MKYSVSYRDATGVTILSDHLPFGGGDEAASACARKAGQVGVHFGDYRSKQRAVKA